jgi:protein-tyrosine phosphatase
MSRARIRLASAVIVAAFAVGTCPAVAAPAPAGAAASHQPSAETIRQIPLQGAVNVRDLGGYRTWTGGQVR